MSCRVLLATSLDPAFPEENITNFDEQNFWISTGSFPQEIVVENQMGGMRGGGGMVDQFFTQTK